MRLLLLILLVLVPQQPSKQAQIYDHWNAIVKTFPRDADGSTDIDAARWHDLQESLTHDAPDDRTVATDRLAIEDYLIETYTERLDHLKAMRKLETK